MAFLEIAVPILARWGDRPEVCAIRLALDLHAAGYSIVPTVPTPEMVTASRSALRRRYIRRDQPITEAAKHEMRLADAVRTGQMQVLFEIGRGS